jgi:hypothetical protein
LLDADDELPLLDFLLLLDAWVVPAAPVVCAAPVVAGVVGGGDAFGKHFLYRSGQSVSYCEFTPNQKHAVGQTTAACEPSAKSTTPAKQSTK